jgi:hypothetical protein
MLSYDPADSWDIATDVRARAGQTISSETAIMQAYNPLDYTNLAKSVVQALLERPDDLLPPREPFEGSGVYAIYYHGGCPGYEPLVRARNAPPIYVGKAEPGGGRKGARQSQVGSELYQRLRQHAGNIARARNLELKDFTCRYLVVEPVWIALAERFLVEHYQPVWNVAIDGFGNHAPGAGREGMSRPRWDILHPGREWADKLKASESVERVLQRLHEFLNRRT